jgi:pSer/pThr/pTyr-binding forkhead associated (FHA) protein
MVKTNNAAPTSECHILTIEDEHGKRTITLDAATYSLGRDQTNAIILNSRAVSRQHALLLRLPTNRSGFYRYRLIDGNASGKASTNGVTVNGTKTSLHDLNSGDLIVLARRVQLRYQLLPVAQSRYLQYLQFDSIDFHSIKSQPINSKATMITPFPGKEHLANELDGDDLPTEITMARRKIQRTQ